MVKTFRDKFYEKYKLDKDEGLSLYKISKLSNIPLEILKQVENRGRGARLSSPESVRDVKTGEKRGGKSLKGKMSAAQWGRARVFGFVMKNPKQVGKGKPDNDLFEKTKKKK